MLLVSDKRNHYKDDLTDVSAQINELPLNPDPEPTKWGDLSQG